MRRSFRFGRLVIVAGIAGWLGSRPSPVRAQSPKAGPEAGAWREAVRQGREPAAGFDPSPPGRQAGSRSGGTTPPHAQHAAVSGIAVRPSGRDPLALLIDEPQQSILSLETRDCKITKFRDDRDTDLAPAEGPRRRGRIAVRGPGAARRTGPSRARWIRGPRATVTVHSPHLPAGGANRLSLEAELVMRYGNGEKTVEQKNVDLKLDKITVGPYPWS